MLALTAAALLSVAGAFSPLTVPRDAALPRVLTGSCESAFGPGAKLDAFAYDAESLVAPAYADGGSVGLSGGIEVAIDPLFCQRMSRLPPADPKYAAACDQIVVAVQDAANVWAERHPRIYFNWTLPITQTDSAELVISTDWDIFLRPDHRDTLAFAQNSLAAAKSHKSQRVQRGVATVMVNPYTCYFSSASQAAACTGRVSGWIRRASVAVALGASLLAVSVAVAALALCDPAKRCGVIAGCAVPLFALAICCFAVTAVLLGACGGVSGGVSLVHSTRSQECFRLEDVLAHELGHVLGVGHPNQLRHIGPRSSRPAANNHMAIYADAPCRQLAVTPLPDGDCADRTIIDCTGHCILVGVVGGRHHCMSVFREALMYSAVAPVSHEGAGWRKRAPAEDDLAALFFLYPSRARRPEWGVAPIPLLDYTVHKLRALSEDVFGGACDGGGDATKSALVACLLRLKVARGVAALDAMAARLCRDGAGDGSSPARCAAVLGRYRDGACGGSSDARCAAVLDLGKAAAAALGGASVPATAAAEAALHVRDAQAAAEAALPDTPNDYTGDPEADALIDVLFLAGAASDANGDGVPDADRDGDGLPDAVEDGLDALREILAEAAAAAEGAAVGDRDGSSSAANVVVAADGEVATD